MSGSIPVDTSVSYLLPFSFLNRVVNVWSLRQHKGYRYRKCEQNDLDLLNSDEQLDTEMELDGGLNESKVFVSIHL